MTGTLAIHFYIKGYVIILEVDDLQTAKLLCLQTHYQFTKQKPFPSLCTPCQRKFLLFESISLSTHVGSGKKEGNFVGMAENTALIKVILPPESILPFQPANLFRTFSINNNHLIFLSLPMVSDSPK